MVADERAEQDTDHGGRTDTADDHAASAGTRGTARAAPTPAQKAAVANALFTRPPRATPNDPGLPGAPRRKKVERGEPHWVARERGRQAPAPVRRRGLSAGTQSVDATGLGAAADPGSRPVRRAQTSKATVMNGGTAASRARKVVPPSRHFCRIATRTVSRT